MTAPVAPTAAVVAAVVGLAGCGSSSTTPTAAPVAYGPVSIDATPANADDTVVATVDGHPIYASCVAAQAAHDHSDARAALRACIDFELLARAAARKGLDRDDEVRDAQRAAMVNRLVERDFEDHVFQQGDFGSLWDKLAARYMRYVDHDEFRASTYVRIAVANDAPKDVDAAAHAAADQIATRVANETGLFGVDLVDLATPIADAAHVRLEHADVTAYTRPSLDPHYGTALFELPDVGRATGSAVHTKWGWDVILYTADVPAAHPSHDDAEAELMKYARKAFFVPWVEQLGAKMGLSISTDKDAVAQLEDLP